MKDQDKVVGEHNSFAKMGMIQFCAISTIVYLIVPVSLIFSYIAFGPLLTKQRITTLLQDILQTVLIAIGVLIVLIWVIVCYLGPTMVVWFGG